jgi:pilus assembly protein Flp/PilA
VDQPSRHNERPTQKGAAGSMFISRLLAAVRRDDDGQGLAEYALILALIAIVAIVALIFLGNQVSTILSTVGSSI